MRCGVLVAPGARGSYPKDWHQGDLGAKEIGKLALNDQLRDVGSNLPEQSAIAAFDPIAKFARVDRLGGLPLG